jgi:serine protease Do
LKCKKIYFVLLLEKLGNIYFIKESLFMKKIIISLAIVCSFLVGMFASANISPKVKVDGEYISTDAIIQNDRVFVPIRAVTEALGADVSWDSENQTAIINSKNENDLSAVIEDVSRSVVAIVGNYKEEKSVISDHVEAMAHGTGVVIKSGGEILTNAHVVKNLDNIIVVMTDGLGYKARIKYIDESIDLAVIKIDRLGLQTIKFAKQEDIVVGKTVIAIGTPVSFSLRNSASKGIVSGINCAIGSDYKLIQSDVAINPGNSGGPLVNTKGELLGINSSKFVSVGIEGMGFAIPVDTVKYALNQFENFGKIKRADIGVTFDESWASRIGLPTQDGLTITKILEGTSGNNAGLKVDDVLIKIGGNIVHSLVDYNEVIKNYPINDKVVFTVIRNEQQLDIEVVLDTKN